MLCPQRGLAGALLAAHCRLLAPKYPLNFPTGAALQSSAVGFQSGLVDFDADAKEADRNPGLLPWEAFMEALDAVAFQRNLRGLLFYQYSCQL